MKKAILTFSISLLLLHTAYSQIIIGTSAYVKNNRQLYSIVVSQDDRIVCNQYFNGKTKQELYNNQSLTKSVISLLMGIAIDNLRQFKRGR